MTFLITLAICLIVFYFLTKKREVNLKVVLWFSLTVLVIWTIAQTFVNFHFIQKNNKIIYISSINSLETVNKIKTEYFILDSITSKNSNDSLVTIFKQRSFTDLCKFNQDVFDSLHAYKYKEIKYNKEVKIKIKDGKWFKLYKNNHGFWEDKTTLIKISDSSFFYLEDSLIENPIIVKIHKKTKTNNWMTDVVSNQSWNILVVKNKSSISNKGILSLNENPNEDEKCIIKNIIKKRKTSLEPIEIAVKWHGRVGR